jgi:hypothetical protein
MATKNLRRTAYGIELGTSLDRFLAIFPEAFELDGAQRSLFGPLNGERVFNANHTIEDNGLIFGVFQGGRLIKLGVGFYTRKGPIRARQLIKKYGSPDRQNTRIQRMMLKVNELRWEDENTSLSLAVRQAGFTLLLSDKNSEIGRAHV